MFDPRRTVPRAEGSPSKSLEERVIELESTVVLLLGLAEVYVDELPAVAARKILRPIPAKK